MTVEKKISFLDFLFLHIIRKSAPLKVSSSYAATARQLAASSIIFCTDDDMLAEPLARAIIGRLFITTAKQGMSRSAFFGLTENLESEMLYKEYKRNGKSRSGYKR